MYLLFFSVSPSMFASVCVSHPYLSSLSHTCLSHMCLHLVYHISLGSILQTCYLLVAVATFHNGPLCKAGLSTRFSTRRLCKDPHNVILYDNSKAGTGLWFMGWSIMIRVSRSCLESIGIIREAVRNPLGESPKSPQHQSYSTDIHTTANVSHASYVSWLTIEEARES